MSDEPWDKPSEKLRALADAPEPTIKPMTAAEKARVLSGSELERDPGEREKGMS